MNRTLNNKTWRMILPIVILVLVSLACSTITPKNLTSPSAVPQATQAAPTLVPIVMPQPIVDEQSLLINLYTRVNPSVVNVTIYANQNNQLRPLGQGSGFVYDDKNDIVTNAHVVHGADLIEVIFSEGTIAEATVVGIDYNSDLAVIRVNRMPEGVQPLPLGNMGSLAVGQTVIAVGNPFGLEGTLTKGIISALGREIPALTQFSIPQSIQTDAAINPGNSGGPLLNLQGEVIGVNAQIETGGFSTSNSGVGFAIPVSVLKRAIPELVANGKMEWSWLGVSGGDLVPVMAKAMGLDTERGAYISQVTTGGPSERAGLRGSTSEQTVDGRIVEVGGDVITAIDGQPVRSFDDLLIYVALQTRPGQEVTLTLIRNNKTMELKVTLGVRPEVLDTNPLSPSN